MEDVVVVEIPDAEVRISRGEDGFG